MAECEANLVGVPRKASPRRAESKRYYEKHKDRILRYSKRQYEKNTDKKIRYSVDWVARNPERHRKTSRAWRQKNADRLGKEKRRWREENRERHRAANRNRKARKRDNGGSHTADDIATIFKRQRKRCAYCRVRLGRKRHVDHIIPLVSGGSNGPSNLQILCQACNLEKGKRDPLDHARSLGMLL